MLIMGKEVPLMPESPQAKFWSWTVGIVVGTMAGWIFLEGYFMRVSDGAEMKADYTKQIAVTNATVQQKLAETNAQIEYSADLNAKRQIENKLFELEQIPSNQLRPQDRALYQKLQRDRKEMVDLWIQRGRPLR
jgi:hypothetical protein